MAARVAAGAGAAVLDARAGAVERALDERVLLAFAVVAVRFVAVAAGATGSLEITSTGAGALVSGTLSTGVAGALLVGWASVVEAGTS